MSLSITSGNASLDTDHPILPPELLPNVLSFISDPITLATCARLCSGFYSISQSRFFHHVAVDFTTCFRGYQRLCWEERDHPRRSPGKFLSLIEHSPHLIVYVKSLAINTGELPTSFVEDQQLRKILPLLTNLSSVSFPLVDEGLQILNLCQGNHGRWLPYLEVLSPTQNQLITSLNLTFLTNLGSRSIVQLDVLRHYPALNNLTLGPLSSSQCQTGFIQRPSLLHTQHLEALTFDGLARDDYDHTVSWLVNPHCPFSVYRLKTLGIKVMPPNKNYQRVEELMELCHVVENFHLVVVPQGKLVLFSTTSMAIHLTITYHNRPFVLPYSGWEHNSPIRPIFFSAKSFLAAQFKVLDDSRRTDDTATRTRYEAHYPQVSTSVDRRLTSYP